MLKLKSISLYIFSKFSFKKVKHFYVCNNLYHSGIFSSLIPNILPSFLVYKEVKNSIWELIDLYLNSIRVYLKWFLIYMCLHFVRTTFGCNNVTQICLNLTKTDQIGLKSQSKLATHFTVSTRKHKHTNTHM